MSDELDTKKRIIDASIHLFGTKGFEKTTTRDIANLAQVNLASINYHFRTKQNLFQEVSAALVDEFNTTIKTIREDETLSAADYASKIFEAMTADPERFYSHFKLFLGIDELFEMEDYPMGFDEFSFYLKKELPHHVTEADLLWAMSVIFGYVIHMAVMQSTPMGRSKVRKFFRDPEVTIVSYIRSLVAAVVSDLNRKYSK